MKQSLYGYRGDTKSPFVKVTVFDPRNIYKVKNKVETGVSVPGLERSCQSDTTYESNLAYLLRFMIDCKVMGSSWIELPAGSYTLAQTHTSEAQIEVTTR
jgi:DNA polymerase delta subunit 1